MTGKRSSPIDSISLLEIAGNSEVGTCLHDDNTMKAWYQRNNMAPNQYQDSRPRLSGRHQSEFTILGELTLGAQQPPEQQSGRGR